MKPGKAAPVLLLAPFLLVLAVFLAGLTDGILQSFGHIPAFGLTGFTLEHYAEVFRDESILTSIGISLWIAVISALVTTSLAVLLSWALVTLKGEHGRLYALLRIPMYIPWVVTALLMIQLLAGGGWLARLFSSLGWDRLASAMAFVLYSPGQLGIILAIVWASTPFACFLIVTVMGSVTEHLGEAAATLGAGFRQRFRYVTLPLCRPVIRSTFLIVLLSSFGSYELPALLGMTTPRALPVEIYYRYRQFDPQQRPMAMALNTVALLLAVGLTVLVRRIRLTPGEGVRS